MSRGPVHSWKRAAGIASLAVFGPFAVMAAYALLFVPCAHCKGAAWMLLPCSPGLVIVEMGRRGLDLPRPDDAAGFALAFAVALGVVAALAWLLRRGGRPAWAAATVAVVVFTLAAIGLLAAIRA